MPNAYRGVGAIQLFYRIESYFNIPRKCSDFSENMKPQALWRNRRRRNQMTSLSTPQTQYCPYYTERAVYVIQYSIFSCFFVVVFNRIESCPKKGNFILFHLTMGSDAFLGSRYLLFFSIYLRFRFIIVAFLLYCYMYTQYIRYNCCARRTSSGEPRASSPHFLLLRNVALFAGFKTLYWIEYTLLYV